MAQQPDENIGARSYGFLLQTLARRMDATMKVKLEAIGIDVKLFANLMMLYSKDGINQRQLGKKLDFPEYYTSRNIDALVRAGWAVRKNDPESRRSVLVFLTDAGKAKAAELPGIIQEANDEHLANLSTEESAKLVMLLQKTAGFGQRK